MTIYIVDIEAVDTRYTKQWKDYLPEQIRSQTGENVEVISGGETPQDTTPGAFLNFGGTNVYKSKQLEKIAEKFCNQEINHGDYFLYTDAWNPTVIQLKYMSELLGVRIIIGGMWHAGSYDSQDFLGRLIGDQPWVRSAEHSMFSCYDHNFYASNFHVGLFSEELFDLSPSELKNINSTVKRVGWPMEYLEDRLEPYKNMEKENLILFPHRLAPEKQDWIFRDLQDELPEYEFVVCQDQTLSKDEYHSLLGRAKLVFSANLQETLGISWYEATLVDAIPMVPDRLSYSEMANDEFKYPSEWTLNSNNYFKNRENIKSKIRYYMENYNGFKERLFKQRQFLSEYYFSGADLYYNIKHSR